MRRALAGLGAVLLFGSACASGPKPTPDQRMAETAKAGYPGACGPLQLEARNQSATGRGTSPDGRGSGTDEVLATYRPGDRRVPFQLSARMSEERSDDLSAHSENPVVVCPGKSGKAAENTPPVD